MIALNMTVEVPSSDYLAHDLIAQELRRTILGLVFKAVDDVARRNGTYFDHTDVRVDGTIKVS